MKEATPTLTINLYIYCPECEHHFCLLDDTDLNNDGCFLDMVVPDGCWADAHKKFEFDVICPKCEKEFRAKRVIW